MIWVRAYSCSYDDNGEHSHVTDHLHRTAEPAGLEIGIETRPICPRQRQLAVIFASAVELEQFAIDDCFNLGSAVSCKRHCGGIDAELNPYTALTF
jgi:hypothetical protein